MKQSEIQSAMGSLPRSIKPQHDLWPGINQRLETHARAEEQQNRTSSWRTPAMAAAVLLALTSGFLIGRGTDTSVPEQSAQSLLEFAVIGTVNATEREYQAAFSELVSLDYSGLRLQGEEPGALRASWEDLVQTETSLLAALREHPNNIFLNEKLLDLRSRQLRFVKQLALLEQNDWRRT